MACYNFRVVRRSMTLAPEPLSLEGCPASAVGRIAAAAVVAGLGVLVACRDVRPARAIDVAIAESTEDADALRATIDALYAAFCFDPGAEPDWATQRRIYLAGAVFIPPLRADRTPETVGVQDSKRFLADFAEYVASEPYRASGFHERIIGLDVGVFGGVAHAFVAFEGFVPGDGATVTRGLDSLQLVHDGERWRLVSFTTQYEADGLVLPERFRSGR